MGSFEKHVSPMTRELSLSGGWCSVTGLSLMLYWLTVPDRHALMGKQTRKHTDVNAHLKDTLLLKA